MNLKNHDGDLLEEAIATVISAVPPADLYARCLDQARSLAEPSVESLEMGRSTRRRSWSAAIVGIAALAFVSVTLPSFFQSGIAIAQIESALAAIKSLRIEMINPKSEEVVRIVFSEGKGYRLESANRLEVDNGEFRLEVDKTRNRGFKFPSKIKYGFQVRQLLGDWTRIPEHNSRGSFERREDMDQVLNKEKLECFVWSEQLGLTQYESLAYRDGSKRIRMLSSRHRIGNNQPWQVDSLIRLSYEEIPKQEFVVNLGADIELVESEIKQAEVNGRLIDENVLATHRQVVNQWPEYYGLKFEVHVRASRSYGPEVDKNIREKCRAFPGHEVEFRDEFSVLAPKEAGLRPRRLWKRYYSENGREVLVSAVAFDGTSTKSYSGRLGGGNGRGLVAGSEEMTPLDDIPNYYEQILFLQLNFANNATPISPELATFDLDRMHLAATHQRDKWIESDFVFYGESTSGQIVYEIKVANHPVNRVVGYQIRFDQNSKQEPLGALEVHDLRQFEETWYPASGILQQAGFGLLDAFVYRFEVENVSRLPEDAADSWWFEWPNGTTVNDQVEKRIYTIEHNRN